MYVIFWYQNIFKDGQNQLKMQFLAPLKDFVKISRTKKKCEYMLQTLPFYCQIEINFFDNSQCNWKNSNFENFRFENEIFQGWQHCH